MSASQQPRPAGKPERITFVVTDDGYKPTRRDVLTSQDRRDLRFVVALSVMFLVASCLCGVFWRIDIALVLNACAWVCMWHEAKLEVIAWRRAYAQSAQVIAALASDEQRDRN